MTVEPLSPLIVSHPSQTSDAIPRPEHPRPDMRRLEWINLNGLWEFDETDDDSSDALHLASNPYPDRIAVPFCRESKLSGLERKGFVKNVWYRRSFTIPSQWRSPRVRLHIGASDWTTRCWVNNQYLGEHVGGNAPFDFDVTRALKTGDNIIVFHVYDDTRSGLQPLGKQSLREQSSGIFYTRTTGIWQTVWLEGVGESYIHNYSIQPDPARSRVVVQAEIDGPTQGLTLEAAAFVEGKSVGTGQTPASRNTGPIVLDLAINRLWSVEDPFLYDLKLKLSRESRTVDEIDAYFGQRTVSIEGAAILINGKPVFQRLVLDQGFYPDGVWTAPTDAQLKGDIELSQALGFNGARLHQKVFEPRFLYWADRLGYLVWGEYPSFGANYSNPAVNLPILNEWVEIVRRDRNHPSIIGWCPFNETPPETGDLQNTTVRMTRTLDPTRPTLDSSGWTHSLPNPELLDAHDYDQNPDALRSRWMERLSRLLPPGNDFRRLSDPDPKDGQPTASVNSGDRPLCIPFFISEYGGIGWFPEGAKDGWGYGNNPRTLEEFYARHAGLTNALLDNRYLCGFCYTQLTDVEQERNGLYTFDRKPKFDAAKIRAANSGPAAYETNPPIEPAPNH